MHASGTDTIVVTHALKPHYKVQIMVSFWWFSGTSYPITVQLTTSTDANIGSGTASPSGSAYHAGASYQPYCSGSQSTNYNLNITDSASASSVKVKFKASDVSANWGLR